MFEEHTPLWRKLLNLLMILAFLGGIYYAWETGAILKGVKWLSGQDPILLTVIAVAILMALAVAFGGE